MLLLLVLCWYCILNIMIQMLLKKRISLFIFFLPLIPSLWVSSHLGSSFLHQKHLKRVPSSLFLLMNGGSQQAHEHEEREINRRWNDLYDFCAGNWSGCIGWYDAENETHATTTSNNGMKQLVLRPDSYERNMRMSFHPTLDQESANWVVYHARGQNIREEVNIEKRPPNDDTNPMCFYSFRDGILGRASKKSINAMDDNFTFPSLVIEHGFWDGEEGMRRTVVLVYDDQGSFQKVCFLQQKRQHQQHTNGDNWDVSDSCREDRLILPSEDSCSSLQELKDVWSNLQTATRETIAVSSSGIRRRYNEANLDEESRKVLVDLLGPAVACDDDDNDETLPLRVRKVLPNGVVISCPSVLDTNRSCVISMGYRRSNGQVQVVQFRYEDHLLKEVQGIWFGQ